MPDSGRSEVRISHSTGKATAKQIPVIASPNSRRRPPTGRRANIRGVRTMAIGSGLRHAIDQAIEPDTDHQDDEAAHDRRRRAAAEVEIEEGEHIGVEAEKLGRT